jgi:hypothetical protein
MFVVETKMDYVEFETYREAEIFCGEQGITCDNIYEE